MVINQYLCLFAKSALVCRQALLASGVAFGILV